MRIGYSGHVENYSWNDTVYDGTTCGTTEQGLRIEAIKIAIYDKGSFDLGLEYQSHVENIGWQDPVNDGEVSGTTGEGLRLEALKISLTGADAFRFDVIYRVHVENYGWQVWYKNGQAAGTVGQALRAEAIEIRIVPKTEEINPVIPSDPIMPVVPDIDDLNNYVIPVDQNLAASYCTHIENYGWGKTAFGGIMSGTVAKGLRLEAIQIKVINKGDYDLGVSYQAYIENTGWQGSVSDGATAGTTEQGLRLEAIKIWLTGGDASKFSIHYRVHVQNESWQEYKKDGEVAGTTEQALRVEAIEIVITQAGISLIREPGQTGGISTEYCTHIENIAWNGWVRNGVRSGTTGRGLRMEALKLKIITLEDINIGVTYRSQVQNYGWMSWASDGEVSGTEGQSLRLEAVQIMLTGADAADYTIMYRVHIENKGWSEWAADGETAGTVEEGLRAEAISIVILKIADANKNITNEVINKAPYIQVWAQEYPYPAYLLHDIRTDYKLPESPQLVDGANSVQSLTFTIDPTHERYNDLHNLRTNIQVYEVNSNLSSEQIFEGRVLNNSIDFNNIKSVTCEGELAYLLDSMHRPRKYENMTAEEFLTVVLDNHNMSVTAEKRLFMGICTVVNTADDTLREYTDYQRTLEVVQDTVNSLGGYLVIRHIGGLRFLDYLDSFKVVNTQPIEFGKNLLDLKKTEYSDGIVTALIPLGDEIGEGDDKAKLTIATVNDNCDFIYDEAAVRVYGWIFGTMEFDGITDPSVLMTKAYDALNTIVNSVGISVELEALDLSQINTDIQKINIGDYVRCVSKPHDVDMFLPVSKITRNLQEANEGSITLGGVMPGLTDYVSGKATNTYIGNTAANSIKNIEFITNELMFLVRVTNEAVSETESRLDEAEFKITAEAITSTVRSSIEYNADLAEKADSGDLDTLTSRVSTAEQKITSDAIVSTVTSSATYVNNLTGKANKSTIISEINQTAEAIKISAAKLNLEGYATFTNLATSGQTTINGANIQTGTLTADKINLNGYISGDPDGLRIRSNGVIEAGTFRLDTIQGLAYMSYDRLITKKMLIYNQTGNIEITPLGYYAKISNLYAANEPYNIPTTEPGTGKIKSIIWASTYVQVETNSGNKGITVWDSDERLKKNIKKSEMSALVKIDEVGVFEFNWIKDNQFEECGFIAQKIEKTLGEKHVLKITQPDGEIAYQINPNGFIPLLTKGIQELNSELKAANSRISELEERVNSYDEIIKELQEEIINLKKGKDI
ncbi:phage tail spike protein [Eubacteriaceae bacterium ES2]|nr:phage tail spike protein [Eubacteriaceae bacterium ES2]